jgi:transcriptional regulator with XRE-family HTH domain
MATKRRDPTAVRIGGRIRSLREDAGLTIPGLADAVKMNRSHVWRVEQGETLPGVATLQKFAKALGVTLADIVAGNGSPPRNLPNNG